MSLKSIARAIGGTFVVLEDEKPVIGAPPILSTSMQPRASTVPTVDTEMVAVLNKTISDRGGAYTALLESATNLADIISDDTTRLKAAARAARRPKPNVMNAIDVHLSDIEGSKMRFQKATADAIAEKSGALRTSAQTLESNIVTRNSTIKDLKNRVIELDKQTAEDQGQIIKLNQQADAAESDIQETAKRFETAAESVKQTLTNQKSQFSTILS